MSLVDRINQISIIRLIIIGVIGFAWLFVLMMIIVGTVAVRSAKQWIPKAVSKAMNEAVEKANEARATAEHAEEHIVEDASEEAARLTGARA